MNPAIRWNIFAAVLEDILHTHAPNLGIGHLDDRKDPVTSTSIHREKVRRLQHSLTTPTSFPVLTPDEVERVARTFHLSMDEVKQLYAAILAASIEETLMDRIPQDQAAAIAYELLPLLVTAFKNQDASSHLADMKVGHDQPAFIRGNHSEYDSDVAYCIDNANIAVHLLEMARSQRERIRLAQNARTLYQQALRLLEDVDNSVRSDIWLYQYHEAHQGLLAIEDDFFGQE